VTAAPLDYTNIGYDALRTAMLALARERLPEWTDQSAGDLGVLLVELFAHAADLTMYYQTRIAANLLLETADEPDAVVSLLRLIGYEPAPPAPASVDLEIAVDDSAATTVPARTPFTVAVPGGQRLTFETTADVVLDPLPTAGSDGLRRFFPLPVVEGSTVTDDPAPVSDGSANQRVALRQKPVIRGSVAVTVTEGGGETRWQEVPTLAESTPADRHFVTRRDVDGATTVQFGDGTNGMVPPPTSPATEVRVVATYRVGGGREGNVAARQRFVTTRPGIKEAVNPSPAAGGTAAEDLDRARTLAPRLYRTQERAVTRADHEDIALQVPGVGKVKADATSWNDVVLYVAPTGRVAPPSELLTRDLLAHFERYRMAGQSIRITGPRPVDVYLGAVVRARPFFARAAVQRAVEEAVAGYLAFDAVAFGQRVFLSKVYDLLQDLEQVDSLTVFKFSRTSDLPAGVLQDPDVAPTGVLELAPFELPRPGYRDAPEEELTAPGLPGVNLARRPTIVTIIEGGAP
jgi:hypothetical protein